MNKVCITGRLGKDPELKKTANDVSVLSFSLAVAGEYNSKTKSAPTYWLGCLAWRGTAEFIARNFLKGDGMEVSGHLQTREWKDRDGNNRVTTEIVVESAGFCIGGGRGGIAEVKLEETEDDEDLPF